MAIHVPYPWLWSDDFEVGAGLLPLDKIWRANPQSPVTMRICLMLDLLMDFIFDLSEGQQALIMFGSMILMIVLAVPIPIAVAIGTAIGYFMMDLNLVQVVLSMYTGVEPFPLVTVPLFVFAGSLMEQGGMARRIVNMAQSMIGNYTGSLGLVAVLGCAFCSLVWVWPSDYRCYRRCYDTIND